MNKEFILYEQALELKQLGFDEPCLYCYFPNPNYKLGQKFDLVETNRILPNQIKNIGELVKDGSFSNTISAPLYQQAFRWFRENYGLSGWVNESFVGSSQGVISIKSEIGLKYHTAVTKLFDTYEEAELACLIKLIEIVKNK